MWIHTHHLLGATEQSCETMPMPWWFMRWHRRHHLLRSSSQNLPSWAEGEAHGMLLREGKENVLYIKQLSDDSMENTALNTPYFCSFIRNDYIHVWTKYIDTSQKGMKKTTFFSTMPTYMATHCRHLGLGGGRQASAREHRKRSQSNWRRQKLRA